MARPRLSKVIDSRDARTATSSWQPGIPTCGTSGACAPAGAPPASASSATTTPRALPVTSSASRDQDAVQKGPRPPEHRAPGRTVEDVPVPVQRLNLHPRAPPLQALAPAPCRRRRDHRILPGVDQQQRDLPDRKSVVSGKDV